MPTELHYYGAQGRAQQIRYTMAEGGLEWDDACAPFPPPDDVKAKWLELGKNTTTNVPMLVMDGRAYTQSSAVLRLVARKGGLMPTDIGQQYEVDNVLAAVEDYRTEAYTVIFGVLGGAPDAAKIARLKDVVLPQHFTNLERLLGADDYFVANTLSVAQRVGDGDAGVVAPRCATTAGWDARRSLGCSTPPEKRRSCSDPSTGIRHYLSPVPGTLQLCTLNPGGGPRRLRHHHQLLLQPLPEREGELPQARGLRRPRGRAAEDGRVSRECQVHRVAGLSESGAVKVLLK